MKIKLSIIVLIVLSVALTGQTRVTPPQLVPAPASGTLMGILNGRFAILVLDSASFVIDTTTTPATIRLVAAPAPPSTEAVEIFRPTTAQSSFSLAATPIGMSLQVIRNGLAQTSPDDYSVAGRTVTIGTQSGDLLQFRYQK